MSNYFWHSYKITKQILFPSILSHTNKQTSFGFRSAPKSNYYSVLHGLSSIFFKSYIYSVDFRDTIIYDLRLPLGLDRVPPLEKERISSYMTFRTLRKSSLRPFKTIHRSLPNESHSTTVLPLRTDYFISPATRANKIFLCQTLVKSTEDLFWFHCVQMGIL